MPNFEYPEIRYPLRITPENSYESDIPQLEQYYHLELIRIYKVARDNHRALSQRLKTIDAIYRLLVNRYNFIHSNRLVDDFNNSGLEWDYPIKGLHPHFFRGEVNEKEVEIEVTDEGIKLPSPHLTILFREGKPGNPDVWATLQVNDNSSEDIAARIANQLHARFA